MSEEEKEAIAEAKKQIKEAYNLNELNVFMTDSTTLKTLLNLIDKLQKENKDNFHNFIKEKTRADKLLVHYNKQKEKLEVALNDLKEMTKANNHKKENWVHKNILNSYIHKDKIRELREIDNIDYLQFKLKELLGEN